MKKFLITCFAAVAIVFYLSAYAMCAQKDISENVIRLHIIANSNSELDQSVKLKVRDEILNNVSFESDNVYDLKNEINRKLEQINFYANEALKSENVNYTAKSKLCTSNFPTKKYANIKLPCGEYTALKISLGEASGENWWCVMFPPLCFTDGSTGYIDQKSQDILKSNLSQDEFKLITSDETAFQIKFKIVELLNTLK